MAEAIFNQLNQVILHKAKSAGIIEIRSRGKGKKRIFKEYNLYIQGNPKGINPKLLQWQDTIVVVADDIPRSIFRRKFMRENKVVFWSIPDPAKINENKTIAMIYSKVRQLLKKLS